MNDSDRNDTPQGETLAELAGWQPEGGVFSIYLDLEPGDRGEAWRIELRNGLRSQLDAAAERGDRASLERAAARIETRLLDGRRPDGRARIGFVEVGENGRELWYSLKVTTGPTAVSHAPRPVLGPLLAALDDGAPRGVLAVSSEEVRLLDWRLGEIEEVVAWGIDLDSEDWRERRSQRPAAPARAQGVTASGRDQHDQRVEANRDRFLRDAATRCAERAAGRDWEEIDVFAEEPHFRLIAESIGKAPPLRHLETHNVVSQPAHAIAERLQALLPDVNREREHALIERVRGEAHGGTKGALGLEETLQALLEGRVEHLLMDPTRPYELAEDSKLAEALDPGIPLAERMIELAVSTSAAVTPLEGDAADRLAEHGGVAALLRY